MEKSVVGPKLQQLENFLRIPESEESKNYISDLLEGETSRPEELFVQKFLNVEFWKELGYDDSELKFERPAGVSGRVEWTLKFDGKVIAIECKRPYFVKKGREVKNELDGNDIDELKDQIGPYLLSHQFIIFTNGFHWYFYSRESYRAWLSNKDKKDNELTPYFKHFTSDEIFKKNSTNYILNILHRQNVIDSLNSMESKSIRHVLTDEFFEDLKNWVNSIDTILKDTPADEKARTTSLINKLIFMRTMEAVGIIPNNFLAKNWEGKRGLRKSVVNFTDQIDDDFSEIYDTELFTSRYLEDRDGNEIEENGQPVFNPARKKNYAYKALPEEFFSALLKQTDEINLKDTGITKLSLQEKTYYVRSLYWWKFESISADILGKAYETYLATERKKFGIYYTPRQITEYLTNQTVGPVFDEKISQLKDELDKDNWDTKKIESLGKQITELKICDPSCGSGSFLIQAIRIIWSKYKELETLIQQKDDKFTKGQATLDPHFRDDVAALQLLRVLFRINDPQQQIGTLILRHIFGNDKDVKAIDTAKLNIWLECLRLVPNSYRKESLKGKRHVLPNLELNLTVGDSLVGLDVESSNIALQGEPQKTIESIFKLRKLYVESFDKTSIAHDATTLRDSLIEYYLSNAFSKKITKEKYENIIKFLKPTYWSLQHWDAFYDEKGNLKPKEKQGFDVIIGNPPWERLKIQDREFFAQRDPNIANASTASIRKKMIKQLETSNPRMYNDYQNEKNSSEQQVEYLRDCGRFPYGSVGDVNIYPIFLELSLSLLKKTGRCGLIVKTGIMTDFSYQKFFKNLVDTNSLISCDDFSNKQKIFEDVIENERFSLLLLTTPREKKSKFSISVLNQSLEELQNGKRYSLDSKDLELFNPNSGTCPLFSSKNDFSICKEIYEKNPVLVNKSKDPPDDPWNFKFWSMFHLTNDSGLFNLKENLEKQGFKLRKDCLFVKNKLAYLPLYEAKLFDNYNHRHGSFENIPPENKYGVKAEPYHPTNQQKMSQTYEVEPRYWVSLEDVKQSCKQKNVLNECFFAFRDVCRTFTDSRTARGTIIPYRGVGNTASLLSFNEKDEINRKKMMILFTCVFSSFTFDYVVRQKISGAHLSKYILEQIAAPAPKTFHKLNLKYNNTTKTAENWCLKNALEVLPVTNILYDFFKIFDISKPIIWNAEERFEKICFIDAVIAHCYSLSNENYEYILNKFPILRRQEEEKFGKYLSLEKCLKYFHDIKVVKQ